MILGARTMRWTNIGEPPWHSHCSNVRTKSSLFRWSAGLALMCWLTAPSLIYAQEDTAPISREEVWRRWHSRLDGKHFTARVRMDVDLAGLTEQRRLTIHRDDEDGRAERLLIQFDAPESLRNLGLLYFEQLGRPNDYFLYRPAVRRVRRLQQSAITNNLYGVDPEFLGFGIAETEPTWIQSMQSVRLNGHDAYRLVEKARGSNPRFEERIVWIDRENYIPLRTEHRLNSKRVLTAETIEIRSVQGVPTPMRMHFERPLDGTRVQLVVEEVDYERPIPEHVFSVFTLMKSQRARK